MYATRPATPEDAETIARFNQAMALETEGKQLDLPTLVAGVRAVFEEPGHGRYLVATATGGPDGGMVVACLMITYEWSDWRNGRFWWIQSVYVAPDHRRRGVFRQLYDAVRAMGEREGGVCGYRLYVEQDNQPAQATYRHLGMAPTVYRVFEADLGA